MEFFTREKLNQSSIWVLELSLDSLVKQYVDSFSLINLWLDFYYIFTEDFTEFYK